ncbi:MBL fold metallo-hydrolase [Xenophilus azovorans]|uniref:MBL fold metallo-hydrolase n=1 Tax=Xenophilus azovorans TaxID=151755 RepID=UPI00056EF9A3|nr:MBL fold metallo-hydrolase [Xenophilus azovorans]
MDTPAAAIRAFHDTATGTVSYVVWDRATRRAAAIDPVLDFDAASGRTATRSVERLLACLREEGLALDWILETHAHADHLSGARHLQTQAGGRIAIGEHIREVQAGFARLFNMRGSQAPGAEAFDRLLRDGETIELGGLRIEALWVPGHTPADMAYRIGDDVFVGDTLFMPDLGTARADFPGGDAHRLYRSIRRLLDLPPHTAIHVCHDYPPPSRGPQWRSTVAEQRARNIHVHDGVDEAAFVALRTARDATLGAPALILPSLQINIHGGRLPAAEDNGIAYLRIPVDALGAAAPG